jgi:hypothetical protein
MGRALWDERNIELTIVYHPLPDMKLEEFIATIRRHDSASAGSQLLVLTEGARPEDHVDMFGGAQVSSFL